MQAFRCYEHNPPTSRRLVTNFRAAECLCFQNEYSDVVGPMKADFSIQLSREQRRLQEGNRKEKNERRERERDRVCCLYRDRLGGAEARLRAAEFDGVRRGGGRTHTQTGSGGSLGCRTVSTIRGTSSCRHRDPRCPSGFSVIRVTEFRACWKAI